MYIKSKGNYFNYTGEQAAAVKEKWIYWVQAGRLMLVQCRKTKSWAVLMGLDKEDDSFGGSHIIVGEWKTQKAAAQCFERMDMAFANRWVKEA